MTQVFIYLAVCPGDWHGLAASGKCYKQMGHQTYRAAQTECEAFQGRSSLAVVKSAEVDQFLRKIRSVVSGQADISDLRKKLNA